jgi:hypothetical protein
MAKEGREIKPELRELVRVKAEEILDKIQGLQYNLSNLLRAFEFLE